VRARARARRGESARDSMYTMQCARKDEVFVGGELRETIGKVPLKDEPAGFVYHPEAKDGHGSSPKG